MEAMIFAAGLGTRLKPLTLSKPKALVEVNNKSLLEHNITKLIDFGCTRIVVNVHHFAQQIEQHIKENNYNAEIIISNESPVLLDTAGGLVNAKKYFSLNEDILVHNVDIISKIDFNELYNAHKLNNSLATMACSQRQTSRYLLFDDSNILRGWQNETTQERIVVNNSKSLTKLGFSGVQIINPNVLTLIEKQRGNNSSLSYPIIPEYLILAKSHDIKSFLHSKDIWVDVGKIEAIAKAETLLSNKF